MPSGLSFARFDAFGICTRRTARGCHDVMDWCTRTATSALASGGTATSPSIPAVLRPVLRCVTCPGQRAFAPGHQARYPASYARRPAEGRPGDLAGCLVFLPPFGCRHSLLEHPVPPGASAPLTIGLPRQTGADPGGVCMFRTH